MKQLFSGLILVIIFSCNQKPDTIKKDRRDTIKIADAVVSKDTTVNNLPVDPETETGTFYLVEIAVGHSFDSLKNISLNAATILRSKFDMLGRIYKPNKGIIVPENSDDEIYRGDYYPRRPFDDQNFVSIEMSNGLNNKEADTLEMVSLAGMYTLKSQADSVALLLKNKIPSIKITKRELYLGCMH